MVPDDLLDLLAAQDVLLGLVREEQVDLDVLVVSEHEVRDLQHGGDPRSAGDHDELPALLRLLRLSGGLDPEVSAVPEVLHVPLGALHVDRVADLQGIQVLAELSTVGEPLVDARPVDLDDQDDLAEGGVVADGGVRADDRDLLSRLRVGLEESERHVLAGRQSEDGFRRGKPEDELGGVVRQNGLANQREFSEIVEGKDRFLSVLQHQEH
mmetsp:Transcript_21483/g.51244  ORF Transcript_21483/g.51244 Transcript_21483/m.51244 type:complete len:211 (+) Transcript_21483:344-976(+)